MCVAQAVAGSIHDTAGPCSGLSGVQEEKEKSPKDLLSLMRLFDTIPVAKNTTKSNQQYAEIIIFLPKAASICAYACTCF